MIVFMNRNWWLYLVRGIIAVLFGIMALLWPAITIGVLVILFGAYVLIEGVLAVGSSLRNHNEKGWWILLLEGLAGIIIGIFTFFIPSLTAQILLLFIALWALVTGVLEIAAAVALRKDIQGEWILALSGIFSVLIGILLLASPGTGLLAIVWLIGLYAVVFGALLIYLGIKLRKPAYFTGTRPLKSDVSTG